MAENELAKWQSVFEALENVELDYDDDGNIYSVHAISEHSLIAELETRGWVFRPEGGKDESGRSTP